MTRRRFRHVPGPSCIFHSPGSRRFPRDEDAVAGVEKVGGLALVAQLVEERAAQAVSSAELFDGVDQRVGEGGGGRVLRLHAEVL